MLDLLISPMTSANINTPNHLSSPFRILIAEDEPDIRDDLRRALRRTDLVIDFAVDTEEVLSSLAKNTETPSLIILDLAMASKNGIKTLKEIRYRNLKLPVIMISGVPSAANRAEAMENGANGFLTTPVSHDELRTTVDALLSSAPCVPVPRRPVGVAGRAEPNLKAGNWIRGLEPLLNRLAGCDVPVLLQGETGVGKEVLARQIHHQSVRSGRIFLKLNCAALPPELVESELFGYEKGAFTGAFKSTPGKFELAHGGTILLDEIGDMDLRLQAKLLQVLQDHEFHRIGAKEATQVDVRVIAATHRDLADRISQGEFREDLYYRLNVLNIVIPPLRERLDEIIPLASSFLKKHANGDSQIPEIGASLRSALLCHHWPGNIRELENVMRRYLVVRNPEMIVDHLQGLTSRLALGDRLPRSNGSNDAVFPRSTATMLDGSDLFSKPALPGTAERARGNLPSEVRYPVNQIERAKSELVNLDQVRQAAETEVIMKALYSTQWNRKRAASLLGVDYKALLYKMKKLGID